MVKISNGMVTTDLIKALRDETGISVMQCKKALEEAGGDREKALIILRKKSGEIAAKKGDRTLGAGAIGVYLHATGKVASMVALLSETDFVAKNDEFKKLAYEIAMHVAASNPEYISAAEIPERAREKAHQVFAKEAAGKSKEIRDKIIEGKLTAYFKDKILLEQPFIKNPGITIGGLIEQAVQKFGERIEVSRFERVSV